MDCSLRAAGVQILLLADPKGELAKELGITLDAEKIFGTKRGKRWGPLVYHTLQDCLVHAQGNSAAGQQAMLTWGVLCRFSAVIEGGKFKSVNVEPDGAGITCSASSEVLSQLK